MTNIPGLFAVGEVDYQYHGANRLGANSLISCLYGGMVAGPAAVRYATKSALPAPSVALVDGWRRKLEDEYARIWSMTGPMQTENPYQLWWELGKMMTDKVTVVRHNQELKQVDAKLVEMMDRWKRVNALDGARHANQAVMFTRQLWNMLVLARVITIGALLRDESRGSHYKPEFPERDDDKYLKSTIASFNAADHAGPTITYEDVDISLVKPVKRDYGAKGTSAPKDGSAAPAAPAGARPAVTGETR
jgi:succinate dehydrogenase / fumarate reductase flavoprotein subunit